MLLVIYRYANENRIDANSSVLISKKWLDSAKQREACSSKIALLWKCGAHSTMFAVIEMFHRVDHKRPSTQALTSLCQLEHIMSIGTNWTANNGATPGMNRQKKNLPAQRTRSRIKLIKALWESLCSAQKRPTGKSIRYEIRTSRRVRFIDIWPEDSTLPNSVCVCSGRWL